MGAISNWPVWLRRWWFPVALVFAVFAGYGVGKDRAMTENNRDAAARPAHQLEG